MAPEYSRAALGLYPLVPMYAVDCDEQQNKRLCAEQGVQGFPTVKRHSNEPITYDAGERTASAFFYWTSRRIPNTVTKLYHVEDIPGWVEKVLGNKYQGQLELASHRDRRGKSSVKLGYEAGEKNQAKVLVYAAGSTKPVRFEGILKHDSLSKFFDSVIDGTADLTVANDEAKSEEFVPDEEELEIQRKQEAQRIALAHGGFSDLIDFEKAIKEGHGADFHDTHGFPGMMGDVPYAKKKEPTEEEKKRSAEAIKEESTSSTGMPETRKAEATSTADQPVAHLRSLILSKLYSAQRRLQIPSMPSAPRTSYSTPFRLHSSVFSAVLVFIVHCFVGLQIQPRDSINTPISL
ncbi:Thioredoxin domain-containing protein [Salix suchowensis]|nr:Thioredoxin domain-containing protein [Salix suchowensis]